MPQSLAELEQRREATAQRIAQLGDLRPGSISNTSGRCGKPSCHCHQPGQSGHGPNLRLTYKADGKTISESLPSPAAIHKAEREVAEFRKFQESVASLSKLMPRSVTCGQPRRNRKPARKKNGRSHPKGSRARSRPTVARGL